MRHQGEPAASLDSPLDGKKPPGSTHSLELVVLSYGESDRGPCDQINDRSRHQHFSGTGEAAHPLSDVDGYPSDVIAATFDLARVQPGPHGEP